MHGKPGLVERDSTDRLTGSGQRPDGQDQIGRIATDGSSHDSYAFPAVSENDTTVTGWPVVIDRLFSFIGPAPAVLVIAP